MIKIQGDHSGKFSGYFIDDKCPIIDESSCPILQF